MPKLARKHYGPSHEDLLGGQKTALDGAEKLMGEAVTRGFEKLMDDTATRDEKLAIGVASKAISGLLTEVPSGSGILSSIRGGAELKGPTDDESLADVRVDSDEKTIRSLAATFMARQGEGRLQKDLGHDAQVTRDERGAISYTATFMARAMTRIPGGKEALMGFASQQVREEANAQGDTLERAVGGLKLGEAQRDAMERMVKNHPRIGLK